LSKERILVSKVDEARFEDVDSKTGDLSVSVVSTTDCEDEGAHRSVLGDVRERKLIRRRRVEDRDEVGVRSLIDRSRGRVRLLQEILLAILVDGKDSSPDVDENGFEFDGGSLEETEDVGEDTDRERDVDCPRTEIEEFAEEDESLESVGLGEEDLQNDGELFWMPPFCYCSLLEPDLEGSELFGEESRVDVRRRRRWRKRRRRLIRESWRLRRERVEPPLFVFEESWKLSETHIDCEIPTIPERVIMCLRKGGNRNRSAFVEPHDAFGEKETSEECCDDEIVSEEFLEEFAREGVPSDRVGDGGEDPGEFSERCSSIVELAGNLEQHINVEIRFERIAEEEESESDFDRRSEAAGEEIGGEVGIHRKLFVAETGS